MAASLSSGPYVNHDLLRPQSCCDGKHSDAIIRFLRGLLDNTQDEAHHMVIYHRTRVLIKHWSYNIMDISDVQLHAIDLSIFDGI